VSPLSEINLSEAISEGSSRQKLKLKSQNKFAEVLCGTIAK
jgi:hypothetical protein